MAAGSLGGSWQRSRWWAAVSIPPHRVSSWASPDQREKTIDCQWPPKPGQHPGGHGPARAPRTFQSRAERPPSVWGFRRLWWSGLGPVCSARKLSSYSLRENSPGRGKWGCAPAQVPHTACAISRRAETTLKCQGGKVGPAAKEVGTGPWQSREGDGRSRTRAQPSPEHQPLWPATHPSQDRPPTSGHRPLSESATGSTLSMCYSSHTRRYPTVW